MPDFNFEAERFVEEKNYVAVWWQITVAVLVFIYFELGYLWSGMGHRAYDAINATFPIDHAIPLIPFFIIFYMLGYLFVFLPCFLLREKAEFFWGVTTFILMLSIAFLFFKYLPIYMHKTYALGNDEFSKLTHFQQTADVSYNNCPSLHVTLNLFSWLVLLQRWPKTVIWLTPIPLLIIISTLFVKQHLVIDVLGGIVLAILGYIFWRSVVKYLADYATVGFGICLIFISAIVIMSYRQLSTIGMIVCGFIKETYRSMSIISIGILFFTILVFLICFFWIMLMIFKSRKFKHATINLYH